MSTYEQGFARGEGAAFQDRKDRAPLRSRPERTIGEWQRGWWDGYVPRSFTWALRASPVRHWQERSVEDEPA